MSNALARTTERRTQAERREATITRLVDATIHCLVQLGYAGTSVKAIAAEAGLSQGAIFRHFDTRQDLLIATMESIDDRFIEGYRQFVRELASDDADEIRVAIKALHRITNTPEQIAWFEVQQAARTDQALQQAFRPIFLRNQNKNIALAGELFPDTLSKLPMRDVMVQLLIQVFHGQTLDAHIEQDEDKAQRMLDVATQLGQLGVQLFGAMEKQAD